MLMEEGVLQQKREGLTVNTATAHTYHCDYKVLSWGTKIVVTDDENNEVGSIKGGWFKAYTDPLTFTSTDGQTTLYADDEYAVIGQDNHAIYRGKSLSITMYGRVSMFGNMYTITNRDGDMIATAYFSALKQGAIYSNDILIAEYKRSLSLRDYTVTIYDNTEIEDEEILMICASFTSDVVYDETHGTNSNSSNSNNHRRKYIIE